MNSDVAIGANGGIIGYNLFAYCNNNPVCYIDIHGTECEYVIDLPPFTIRRLPRELQNNITAEINIFPKSHYEKSPSSPTEVSKKVSEVSRFKTNAVGTEGSYFGSFKSGSYTVYSYINSDFTKISDYYFTVTTAQNMYNDFMRSHSIFNNICSVLDLFTNNDGYILTTPKFEMAMFVLTLIDEGLSSYTQHLYSQAQIYKNREGIVYVYEFVRTYSYINGERVFEHAR